MYDISIPVIIQQTAQRIDYLRAENDYTFRELANKSGVSLATIHNIINCKKIPNIFTLQSLCTALNISLSDFFDFNEETVKLRGKEAMLVKIFREVSPMSQDTLIKVSKCMK